MAGLLHDSARGEGAVDAARRREQGENFPVALLLLPREPRRHLHAVYAFARLVDDTGDDPARPPQQRLADLDVLAADLDGIWAGATPVHPVLRELAATVAARRLDPAPFRALVEANRQDQSVRRYPAEADLRDYCALSADPVGRIVLAIGGAATPENVALSDRVCTALQVLEHCQDVVEDLRDRDRIYLPMADLDALGVSASDLLAPVASPAVRRLVLVNVDRAEVSLHAGAALVRRLHGWARIAVAGYVAGGLATVDALRRADGDVVTAVPTPRKVDVLRHALRLLLPLGAGGR